MNCERPFHLMILLLLVFAVGCNDAPSVSLNNIHDPSSDTYVPTPPNRLDAMNRVDSAVALGWFDASLGEEKFIVERRIGMSGDFVLRATLPANTNQFVDTFTLVNNQIYVYRVASVARGTVISYTSLFSVYYSANAPGMRASFPTSTSVKLNVDFLGYFRTWSLERSVDSSAFQLVLTLPVAQSMVIDSTLTPPHSYRYRCTAFTGRNTSPASPMIGVRYVGGIYSLYTP